MRTIILKDRLMRGILRTAERKKKGRPDSDVQPVPGVQLFCRPRNACPGGQNIRGLQYMSKTVRVLGANTMITFPISGG